MIGAMQRKLETRIASTDEGILLGPWLARRFTYLDLASWAVEIDSGRLSLNGGRALATSRLVGGDSVAWRAPDIEEAPVDTAFAILHEDEDYLVIDKPAHLPCHPGGRFFENSLWFLLKKEYGSLQIATRLDRESSGLVLACRTPASARHAQAEFLAGRLHKSYLALVHGSFPPRLSTEGWLCADPRSPVRKKRRFISGTERPCAEAESCATEFFLETEPRTLLVSGRAFPGSYSLVRAEPRTGRCHQIRASLLSLGFPLVGDKLYGLDDGLFLRLAAGLLDEADRAALILPAQALHCSSLALAGRDGRSLELRSAPPWTALI